MKYLDNIPELEVLSRALEFSAPGLRVSSRVEAYSVKPIARERQLFKRLEASLQADIELTSSVSPPDQHDAVVGSAFGPLDRRQSRKTFWLLIATLNAAFPDHDFSGVRPDEFVREPSAHSVLASLSNALNHLRSSANSPSIYRSFSSYPGPATASPPKTSAGLPDRAAEAPTHPFLRQILDPIIDLGECEVYSYQPELDSDPHADESESGSMVGWDDNNLDGFLDDDGDGSTWPMDDLPPATPPRFKSKLRPSAPPSPFGSVAPTPKRSLSSLSFAESDHLSSGGLLWSSNYFFYSKKSKRVLFISLWAKTQDQFVEPRMGVGSVQRIYQLPTSGTSCAAVAVASAVPTRMSKRVKV